MRIPCFCTLLILSALGTSFGQDTNFAQGPQYLMNQGSPLLARPVSTPSLSLNSAPLEVGASNATGDLTAGAAIQNVLPPSPDRLPALDLFPIYYGDRPISVIEVSFPEASEESSTPLNLPASILDAGVWQMTTPQAVRASGYGVTLAEAARYGKTRNLHATHVYTNADIDRLRGRS